VNPNVTREARRRAKGRCEYCQLPAPILYLSTWILSLHASTGARRARESRVCMSSLLRYPDGQRLAALPFMCLPPTLRIFSRCGKHSCESKRFLSNTLLSFCGPVISRAWRIARKLRRLLGLTSRYELDGFLKAHEVWIDYTVEDFRCEMRDLHRRGL